MFSGRRGPEGPTGKKAKTYVSLFYIRSCHMEPSLLCVCVFRSFNMEPALLCVAPILMWNRLCCVMFYCICWIVLCDIGVAFLDDIVFSVGLYLEALLLVPGLPRTGLFHRPAETSQQLRYGATFVVVVFFVFVCFFVFCFLFLFVCVFFAYITRLT